jgi:hypothetical protein
VITAKSEIQPSAGAIEELTAGDFVRYLGRAVCANASGLDMVLDRINQRIFPGWEGVTRKPFSLILRGPRQPVLPEGLYAIEIADGPALTLYVIPILTAVSDHQEYQVVFN